MTAYEVRISDWSSDVCSSDLKPHGIFKPKQGVSQEATARRRHHLRARCGKAVAPRFICVDDRGGEGVRSAARVGDASRRSRCRPQGGKEDSEAEKKKGPADAGQPLVFLVLAPRAGLEPSTWWLTATRPTN